MIIDQLPELTNIFDTDEIPIERGTNTYKTKISIFFSGLRDLIAARVAKSGDTMTGHLDIVNANVQINSNGMENNVPGTANYFGRGVYYRDKNSVEVGTCRPFSGASGTIENLQGMQLTATRTISGTKIENLIRLAIDSEGHLAVLLSSNVPWRKALGLGTNGALPITIAQGGSGQTAVASYGSKSDVIASEATGYTVQDVALKVWGKVAQLAIGVKASSTGTVSNKTVCTLKALALPGGATAVIPGNGNYFTDGTISTAGALAVTGNFASTSTTYYFRATYLLA